MIIVLAHHATEEQARGICDQIAALGLKPLYMPGTERTVLGALGDERVIARLHLESNPLVESVKPILAPYKLVSRELHPHDSVIDVGAHSVGPAQLTIIAGPCSIESTEQLRATGEAVKHAGAHILRGGAFKPRTSPYSFRGLGVEGLEILDEVKRSLGMPAVTEVMDAREVELVADHADAFQVGARNMQNYRLLEALGEQRKPVLLKRGMAAKVEDLLLAAEYIVSEGNPNVILCERGITTFETATRNTLDLNAIPFIKQRSHLPVIVDPSHGTGVRDFVTPMALAAVAAGADGLIIEVHNDPASALSDGKQSLYPHQFEELVARVELVARAVGREVSRWRG